MSVSLDTDSRAEVERAVGEARAAHKRTRLIEERCRSLLIAEPRAAPRTPRPPIRR